MADYAVKCLNAAADAHVAALAPPLTLEIRSGAKPATVGSADVGTVLATLTLPDPYLLPAVGGVKARVSTFPSLTGSAAGVAGHYRIKEGTTTVEQGTVTATGGGGDMTLNNVNIAVGQTITIDTWTLTYAAS